MRKGIVYRRCGGCGRVVVEAKARHCSNCRGERITWAFKVDIAPQGSKRERRSASGFASRREALEAMSRLQSDRIDGRYVEPSKITVREYLDAWLAAGGREGRTEQDYRIIVQRHINPQIGHLRLQDVTSMDIDRLFNFLLVEGKMVKGEGDSWLRIPLSKKTVQNVKICLRKAFNDARGKYLSAARQNPVLEASFKYSLAKDRPEMKTWTLEEQQTFLRFMERDREYPAYLLALATGMRRGELLGLRWRDLDLPSGRLNVRQQWARDGDRGLVFKNLKSGSKHWRTIDLDERTVKAIDAHRVAQEAERKQWGSSYENHNLVFCEPDGRPYDPDCFTERFRQRVSATDVLRIRFHDCRHTHATLLLEDGHSLKYVAERLGDREDTVLRTYNHVTSKSRMNAANRIGKLLWG